MICNNCHRETGDKAVCPYCHNSILKAPLPHHLPNGTLIGGRYRIEGVLGEGGFGITYLGRDEKLDRTVAVKEYYPNGFSYRKTEGGNEVYVRADNSRKFYEHGKNRFLIEAKTLAKFSKEPGVVSVTDYIEENNTAYLIMEYLDGETLQQYLKDHGRLSADETFTMLKPVMQTLEKIHIASVIHRDISPDNIMVLKNGHLKLMDFGAAKEFVDETRSMSVMLKKGFAPEEQYRRNGKQGPWTDVYALCATIYKCITGKTPEESLDRLAEDSLQKPSALGADISPEQERILLYGLAVRKNDRCQSMTELLNLLKHPESVNHIAAAITPPPKDDPNATIYADEIKPDINATLYADDTAIDKNADKIAEHGDPGSVKKKDSKHFGIIAATAVVLVIAIVAGIWFLNKNSASPDTAVSAIPTSAPQNETTADHSVEVTSASSEENDTSSVMKSVYAEDTVISAGSAYTVGLKQDGTVIATDLVDSAGDWGQFNVGAWTDIKAVSAGTFCTVGVKNDGTVVATDITSSDVYSGQTDVAGWSDIKAVSAATWNTIGLRNDGTVVSTVVANGSDYGQTDVGGWTDIIAVAAGTNHTVGLKSDGTVTATNINMSDVDYGQSDVSGWTDIVAVSVGEIHTVGLRSDGTVVSTSTAGSWLDCGQSDVSDWTDIVAISAGSYHTVGLKKDGTVVSTTVTSARYDSEQDDVSGWTDIVAISAGEGHTVGLKKDGTLVAAGSKHFGQCNVGSWNLG